MNIDYNKDNNVDNNTDNKDNNVEKSKSEEVDNHAKESQNIKKQLSDNGSISTKSTFEHIQTNSDSESQIL